MAEGRTLINFQKLPKPSGPLNRQEIDGHIREACAVAERKLQERAQHFVVTGWQIDTEWGHNGFDFGLVNHTIIGKLHLVRPD